MIATEMSTRMNPKLLTALLSVCTMANAQYGTLLEFDWGASGRYPYGSLISDGTFLYGMTTNSGSTDGGTIFRIMPDGTGFATMFDFGDGTVNGRFPHGSLIHDGTFLYGMTLEGGANGMGTLFKILPDGTGFDKLLDFDTTTGGSPWGSLASDGTFLYGMTNVGGLSASGTLFKLMPDGTGLVVLLDFDGIDLGSHPKGSVLFDGTFLYGMTQQGGMNNMGVLFKIMPDGTGFTKLLDFDGTATGSEPFGDLVSDGTFLYGTATTGGMNNLGTLFKIMPDGTGFVKLLDFDGAANGRNPQGNLTTAGAFLYGMTPHGGTNDLGTLFRILPNGTGSTKLLDFDGSASGSNPWGSLHSDGAFLYGLTHYGGTLQVGTIFKYQIPSVGMAESDSGSGFAVHPNPSNGVFSVQCAEKDREVDVVNMLGEVIESIQVVSEANGTYNLDIDLSEHQPGVYFMRSYHGGSVLTQKLVLQ